MLRVFSEILYAKYVKYTVTYSLAYDTKHHLNQYMKGETNLSVSQLHTFGENTLKYIHSKHVRSLMKSVSKRGIELERIEINPLCGNFYLK